MTIVDEYKKQYAWRDWANALSACPILSGELVLDLGCGPGDLSRELAARGAIVTGVDSNIELLQAARENSPDSCRFLEQDLRSLKLELGRFDGLWCSFSSAYFTDFESTFKSWLPFLKAKAWVCIIDIDDLLGHEPLTKESKQRINNFYDEALLIGRYDFKMGRKLTAILEQSGFLVEECLLKDLELSFDGPANSDVAEAWAERFNRMGGLKNYLGENFNSFREEFLQTISKTNHRSFCKVICCVGRRS